MAKTHTAKIHAAFTAHLADLPPKEPDEYTVRESIAANAEVIAGLRKIGYSDLELHALTCEKLCCEISLETFRTYVRTALRAPIGQKKPTPAKPKRMLNPVKPDTSEGSRTGPSMILPDETANVPDVGPLSGPAPETAADQASFASRTNVSEAIEGEVENDAG